jgi:hypothetical protein
MFRHTRENGMTYWQHLVFASTNGLKLIYAGTCCIIHGIMPCWYESKASSIVKIIYEKFNE